MAQTDTNSVVVVGRLVRDSEYREYGQNGKELKFAIANNRGYGDFAHVNFIDCKIHGKRATSLQQYLTKGTQVSVTGEMSQDRWEDNAGNKRSNMFIEAGDTQLLGSSGSNGAGDNHSSSGFAAPAAGGFGAKEAPDAMDSDFNDDIPF